MRNYADWLLPEGVEEILPDQAARLESLRRQVLDTMQAREYQLVMPPVMEFVDSLLTGTAEELDTQTYKFMDHASHRMLGIRADITPQIARIDAHYLTDQEINRLCYSGTVLRTQPSQVGGARELLQTGAELFGIADTSADIEIIRTMLEVLAVAGLEQLTLSLGHVGVYRELVAQQDLDADTERTVFDILLRKSFPDMTQLVVEKAKQGVDLQVFADLMTWQGDASVVEKASDVLQNQTAINDCLQQVSSVVDSLKIDYPNLAVHVDLADVFGYRYHTGLKFAVFSGNQGRAIAKGGRYDGVGQRFGRERPATGFSCDLKALLALS